MATTLRTQWQTKQNYIWLAFGGVCLFGAIVFWAITDQETVVEVEKKAESEVELQIQPEKVATTAHLGSFLDEVKPLDMTTRVVAIAQHEAEFRGTKFIQENKKNSTIELFRVSEEAIIKRFLQRQSDRQAFSYLRLTGENQIEQYVLIYGVYKNANEAQKALADLKLTLPKSVQPKVEKIESYADYVNDLGSDELGLSNKLYAVQLKPAAVPVIDEATLAARQQAARAAAVQNKQSTTSTTVTRRDADGNVVDVQKSQTTVENAPQNKTNEPEVTDPFN